MYVLYPLVAIPEVYNSLLTSYFLSLCIIIRAINTSLFFFTPNHMQYPKKSKTNVIEPSLRCVRIQTKQMQFQPSLCYTCVSKPIICPKM